MWDFILDRWRLNSLGCVLKGGEQMAKKKAAKKKKK